MDSSRRSYYKTYTRSSTTSHIPEPGTSKMNEKKLHVARKLIFKSPKKQKNNNKNVSSNKTSKEKPKFSKQVELDTENFAPLSDNNEKYYDLTDESKSFEEEGFSCMGKHDILQKEFEIFKEISRQHEIEKACDEIQREYEEEMKNDLNVQSNSMLQNFESKKSQSKKVLTYVDVNLKEEKNKSNYRPGNKPVNMQDFKSTNSDDVLFDKDINIKEEKYKSEFRPKNIPKNSTDHKQLTDIIDTQILNKTKEETINLKDKIKNTNKELNLDEWKIDHRCNENFKQIDLNLRNNENIKAKTDTFNIKTVALGNDDDFEICDDINKYEKDKNSLIVSQCERKEENHFKNDTKSKTSGKEKEIKKEQAMLMPEIESIIEYENKILKSEGEIKDLTDSENHKNVIHNNNEQSTVSENNAELPQLEENDTKLDSNLNDKQDEYIKNKSFRQQKRQKYVDFMSDNEDFVWSSSSWEDSTAQSETSESGVAKKKIKKTKQKKKHSKIGNKSKEDNNKSAPTEDSLIENTKSAKKKRENVRKQNKAMKEKGHEYLTKQGKIVPAKEMKPNPCMPNNCTNKCYEISEERREALFSHFWSLDSMRRKDWLVSHSKKSAVKRKRSSNVSSRRIYTLNYFINEGEGQRQICQRFLTYTLDMKQKTIYNTVINSCYGSANEDMRGKHVPINKTSDTVRQNLHKYIQELPALPSHYCRKNSKRTYLPQEFKNISTLYRIYKDTQEKNDLQYVGEKVFKKIFTSEYNIGFHLPRKDKCLKCTQFENDKDFNPVEKENHLKDKEETTERFQAHQEIHKKDDSILCTTFDLQKVLNTPHGDNMMLYYSRKVAVYNLTFYESGTRNGFCYTWSESDGKRGANEVSSILHKYINEVDQRGTIKHLLLYCDSCPGQNKNKTVLTCLNESLQKCNNLLSIQINFLLPGHTYMPVDSIHSVIEKSLNGVTIWAPSQWATVFSLVRKTPKPYEVEVLTYNDFNKWDAVAEKYFKGNLVGKMSKIRTATFRRSNPDMVFVKYSMNVDAEMEQIEIVKKRDTIQLKPCYKALLPISKKKFMDLNKLCANKVIPTVYHEEYKRLNCNNNVQDSLIDTDEEDEGNEILND